MTRKTLLTLALGALLLATPAVAFDSVDEILCVCSDGALNQGDFVTCVSHLSRRLVAQEIIDRGERSDLVSSASDLDRDAIETDCDAGGGVLTYEGWGVSLHVGCAFYPTPTPSGFEKQVEGKLRLWNFMRSGDDAFQTTPVAPADDCGFTLTVRDELGRIVRRDVDVCLPVTARLDLPNGTLEERAFDFGMNALDAEVGLINGERLPVGIYELEARWDVNGPQRADGDVFQGGVPRAVISLRVGSE